MARAPLPRPAPAAGSPENFSLATFQVTHMIVCRSASLSRSWCSQRNLWRKSFQGSHRRARTRAPWLFLVGPARADGSPENFSLATFQVTYMNVCRSASSSRSWCSQRNLWRKSFQESRRRTRAGAEPRAMIVAGGHDGEEKGEEKGGEENGEGIPFSLENRPNRREKGEEFGGGTL